MGGSLTFDRDASLKLTRLVEDLDAIAQPVTYVYKTVVTNNYAVHNPQKHTSHTSVDLGHRPLAPPLPEEVSFAIKDHDTAIAVAVRDIYLPIRGVNRDTRRKVQQCVT